MAKINVPRRALGALSVAVVALLAGPFAFSVHSAPLTAAEMSPIFAMAKDIAEGKEVATASCAKCHGLEGVAASKDVPHIAGQRPSYIYRELKQYQAQAGASSEMYDNVKFLSDQALVKVAAYYASLDPAPLPPTPAPKIADPLESGKAAAATCKKCHGDTFVSHRPGVPNLIAFETRYFVDTLKAYKTGDRKVDAKDEDMTRALEAMSDRDLLNVATYIGLQKDNLTPAQTPVEGDAAAITKEKLGACVKCHGEDGVGASPVIPSLAGQDSTYIVKSLLAYKDGTRDDDIMTPRAKKLNEQEMKDFAAYFAGLTPKGANVAKPLTPVEWAEKCDHCHGVNGNSARPDVPALASQKMDYLAAMLRAYRSRERASSEMSAMASILSDDDINGIAAFYAYQKARSVIFIPVPK